MAEGIMEIEDNSFDIVVMTQALLCFHLRSSSFSRALLWLYWDFPLTYLSIINYAPTHCQDKNLAF